jgi:putative CocE/NonD family hydrolase
MARTSRIKSKSLVHRWRETYSSHTFSFHPRSFSEVNPEHKSAHSVWEVPDPEYWTSKGYVVIRADERGLGQSPGKLDTMSLSTTEAFVEVAEWAAEQSWSTGKVGLLGISYFGGSRWRVAARQPKGLACDIPWEGLGYLSIPSCYTNNIVTSSKQTARSHLSDRR